jgi:hypothetical protein
MRTPEFSLSRLPSTTGVPPHQVLTRSGGLQRIFHNSIPKMGYNSLILNRFTLRDQFFSSDYSDPLVGDGVRKGDIGLLKQELA